MSVNLIIWSLLFCLLITSFTLAQDVIETPPKARVIPSNNDVISAVQDTLRIAPVNKYENHVDIEYKFAPQKPLNLNEDHSNKDLDLQMQIGISDSSKESPIDLMQKGYNAALVGQFEAALFLYKKAQYYDPENVSLLFAIGTLYHKLQQLSQANTYYKKVLLLNPTHRKALNNFIAVISEQSPKDALQELQRLEKVNANYSPVLAQMGIIYAQLGQFQTAENYLHRAIILSPHELIYKYNLATMYDHFDKKAAAIKMYKEILDYGSLSQTLPQSYESIKQRMFLLIQQTQ